MFFRQCVHVEERAAKVISTGEPVILVSVLFSLVLYNVLIWNALKCAGNLIKKYLTSGFVAKILTSRPLWWNLAWDRQDLISTSKWSEVRALSLVFGGSLDGVMQSRTVFWLIQITVSLMSLALWSRIDDFIRRSCVAKVNFIFQETAISYKKGTSS